MELRSPMLCEQWMSDIQSVVNSVSAGGFFFPSCRRPYAPCFMLKYNTYGIFVGKFHTELHFERRIKKCKENGAIESGSSLSLFPHPPPPTPRLELDLTV